LCRRGTVPKKRDKRGKRNLFQKKKPVWWGDPIGKQVVVGEKKKKDARGEDRLLGRRIKRGEKETRIQGGGKKKKDQALWKDTHNSKKLTRGGGKIDVEKPFVRWGGGGQSYHRKKREGRTLCVGGGGNKKKKGRRKKKHHGLGGKEEKTKSGGGWFNYGRKKKRKGGGGGVRISQKKKERRNQNKYGKIGRIKWLGGR